MVKNLKPVHLIHLLLYTPTIDDNYAAPIFGRTRLMKMIFIFEKELSKHFQNEECEIQFDFEAYNYGPYSKRVYEAIDFLEARDIIEIRNTPSHHISQSDIEIDRLLTTLESNNVNFQSTGVFWNENKGTGKKKIPSS